MGGKAPSEAYEASCDGLGAEGAPSRPIGRDSPHEEAGSPAPSDIERFSVQINSVFKRRPQLERSRPGARQEWV